MTTKAELVKNITKKIGYLTLEDAAYAVDSVIEYIEDELCRGNGVEIRGFGSLSIRKRKYANNDAHYNTIYYRMSLNVQEDLK